MQANQNPAPQSISDFLAGRQSEQYWFSGIWGLEWLGRKYKGLNHIVARDLIAGIRQGKISLVFASDLYATSFADSLIQYKVSIPALVAAMREGNLSFSGQYFYSFLDGLYKYKGYVNEPGLFTDEIMSRIGALTLLPYNRGDAFPSEEEDKYLLNPETPLEIVDILIQKPYDMPFEKYSAFIQSIIQPQNNSQRKTEIILLAIKNLTNYEIAYSDEKTVEKPEGVGNIDFRQDPAEDPVIDPKLELAIAKAGLRGTNEGDIIANIIYQGRKNIKTKIVAATGELRKLLLAEGQELPEKPALDLDKLKTIATSGRCRRIVKRIIMAELKKEGNVDKFTDARKAVAGHENLNRIAGMVALTDQETFKLIGEIMNDAIAEIEAKYNFNPNFWRGTISRGWSTFTSYPIGVFFAVLDFFSLIFEYIVEYSKRVGCKSYETVRGWFGYDVQPRENQEILGRKDIQGALESLKSSLEGENETQLAAEASPEEKLRNAIIDFLADESKAEELKAVLDAFPIGSSIEDQTPLQQAVGKLKELDANLLKDHKKDLQAILEMPRGISDALPSWSRYAKAMEVLRQYSSGQALE